MSKITKKDVDDLRISCQRIIRLINDDAICYSAEGNLNAPFAWRDSASCAIMELQRLLEELHGPLAKVENV